MRHLLALGTLGLLMLLPCPSGAQEDMQEAPLLLHVRRLLASPGCRPAQLTEALNTGLGRYRRLHQLRWTRDGELLALSTRPEMWTIDELDFWSIDATGNQTALGSWQSGIYRSLTFRIMEGMAGERMCLFFDDADGHFRGAVQLRQGLPPMQFTPSPDTLAEVRLWMRPDALTELQQQPPHELRLLSGEGKVIASGALPGNMSTIARFGIAYDAPLWRRSGVLFTAQLTAPSADITRWHETPPCDLTVLRLLNGAEEWEVVRRFTPASPQMLPPPDVANLWDYRRMAHPAATSDGTRVAFAERIQFHAVWERACIWRLWVWQEESDTSTLISTRGEYSGPAGTLELTPGAGGGVIEQPMEIDSWASAGEMTCAFSSDGRTLAYAAGQELHVVALP